MRDWLQDAGTQGAKSVLSKEEFNAAKDGVRKAAYKKSMERALQTYADDIADDLTKNRGWKKEKAVRAAKRVAKAAKEALKSGKAIRKGFTLARLGLAGALGAAGGPPGIVIAVTGFTLGALVDQLVFGEAAENKCAKRVYRELIKVGSPEDCEREQDMRKHGEREWGGPNMTPDGKPGPLPGLPPPTPLRGPSQA